MAVPIKVSGKSALISKCKQNAVEAIANAVIIICISIWAIIESKKEPGTEKLEKEIELLKKKVEKMNFIKKDTLKINNLN